MMLAKRRIFLVGKPIVLGITRRMELNGCCFHVFGRLAYCVQVLWRSTSGIRPTQTPSLCGKSRWGALEWTGVAWRGRGLQARGGPSGGRMKKLRFIRTQ